MKLPTSLLGLQSSIRKKVIQKDDRGKYGEVFISDAKGLKGRKFFRVVPTLALLLAGITLVLAHHFFYSYLDSKIIDPVASELPPILRDRRAPNIIGILTAHGVCAILTMIINSTFYQLFWERLRTRTYSIQQMDALAQTGRGPFHLSMFQAMATAPLLSLISFVAATMSLVVVLSPGSLTITSALQRSETCLVPNVPNFTEFKYEPEIVPDILAAGTYIPPLRADACDNGAPSCSYNVSFHGPAFECLDVSDQTDFGTSLDSSDPSSIFQMIWNSSSSTLSMLVSTWDMVNNVMQANNCSVYQANYKVCVTADALSGNARARLIALEAAPPVPLEYLRNSHISRALGYLEGDVYAGPNGSLYEVGIGALSNSKMFVTTPSGNHTWSDNMTNVLTSIMQNATISLLSGVALFNTTNGTLESLLYVNSSCVSTWDGYVYSSARLLATYIAAFICALCIAAFGVSLISRNGIEESIVLSHILRSVQDLQPYRSPKDSDAKTQIPMTGQSVSRILGNAVSVQGYDLSQRVDIQNTAEKETSGDTHSDKRTPLLNSESMNPTSRHIRHLSEIHLSPALSTTIPFRKRLQTRLKASKTQMVFLISSGVSCGVLHHLYYIFLDGKPPARWETNQSVVNDLGIAIAYAGQICFAAAITISSSQLFWRTLRKRRHTIHQIDTFMRTQQNPFSLSSIRSTRVSLVLAAGTIIYASMPLISTFAPNSIKLSFDHLRSSKCTVKIPRDLTSLRTSNISDYSLSTGSVFISGTYQSPVNQCGIDLEAQCSYSFEFIGPGFYCSDVTASRNYTTFEDTNFWGPPIDNMTLIDPINVWHSSISGDSKNRTLRLSVQTWDIQESVYQALDCAGVARSYSIVISHGSSSSSTIEIIHSDALSPVLVDLGANLSMSYIFPSTTAPALGAVNHTVSFMQQYLFSAMTTLVGAYTIHGEFSADAEIFSFPNILSPNTTSNPDLQTISWSKNMASILEQYAQNATLSLLSGQISALNSPDGPELLEDFETTCNYVVTAYEYSPSQLLATYGVAIIVTVLCVAGGFNAIKLNGVDESMDFSRFLRAVSNERMLNVRGRIEMETAIKADNDVEGGFAPVLESDI